jgi:hypothetical protein
VARDVCSPSRIYASVEVRVRLCITACRSQLGDRQCGRVALPAVLQSGADHSVNIREHKDLAPGWESGIGTTGQYPRQDLIPGNMDDGFHHRDDEAVLGVRATRVSGWEAK